jgi:hypothetical protein
MSTNPWVAQPDADVPDADDATAAPIGVAFSHPGPAAPQPSVSAPDDADRFPRRDVREDEEVVTRWWVGAHGGAGESTLELLVPESRAAGHAWPVTRPGLPPARVVLVARTNAGGLRAAQLAATEWASGGVPVELEGLVLIADAPGRAPRALKDFAELVAGGVPMVWRLPWVEEWRTGEPVSADTAVKNVSRFVADLQTSRLPGPT